MQAYEFNATVHDGIIHIPKQLSDEKLSWVKVILLTNSSSMEKPSEFGKRKFSAMRLKTKGFTFNREEAHER